MNYFYARVSSVAQNEARQLDAAKKAGISPSLIFVDKESGKDFNRTNWKILMTRLKKGDVLFVKSIDRIGRDYKEIIRVWQELTKDREIDVVVLDMPLLDTRKEKGLLGTFVADIVLQILSFVAENERVNIRERQRQGIDLAIARGVKFGRPKRKLPRQFEQFAKDYLAGKRTGKECAKELGVPHTTFCNKAFKIGVRTGKPDRKKTLPDNFKEIARLWLAGELTRDQAAKKVGFGSKTFSKRALELFPGRRIELKRARKKPGSKSKNERSVQLRLKDVRLPSNFYEIARLWLAGELRDEHAATYCNMAFVNFQRYALAYKAKLEEKK